MIITIDGLPAAGKTSLTKILAKELKVSPYHVGTGVLDNLWQNWNETIVPLSPIMDDGMPKFLWSIGLWHTFQTQKLDSVVCDEFWYRLFEMTRRANMSGPIEQWHKFYDIMMNALEYIDVIPTCSFYIEITPQESYERAIKREEDRGRKPNHAMWKRKERPDDLFMFWNWLKTKFRDLHIINGMRPQEKVADEMFSILLKKYL